MTISREAGLRVVDEALAAVHATGERMYEAELYRLKGELVRMQSPAQTKAETCLHQALAKAYNLLAPIYGWFIEGFDTADLQKTKALLAELA